MLIKNRFKSNEFFTFTGIWIFFIILNSASSQLPNYIFTIVPLIAVLTAKWIDIALKNKTTLLRVFQITQNSVVVLLWLSIFIFSFYFFPVPKAYFWIFVVAGLIFTFYIFLRKLNAETKLIVPSLLAFTCLSLLLNTQILPYTFNFRAPPR